MRVLVACEFSGIVREAFQKRGHDAWSCDLLPTEIPGQHIQDDVLKYLDDGWDLMIAHPPCTFISYAGTSSWNNPGRIRKRLEALEFFRKLWEAPIKKIAIENPKSCASPIIAKYSQEIQPYYFGGHDIKTTWLWLKNLPPLKHSQEDTLFEKSTHTDRPLPISIDATPRKKKRYFTDALRDPHQRSRTFTEIANAMAEQWG
jgi:hypothetical protein